MRIIKAVLLLFSAAASTAQADYFTEAIAVNLEQEDLQVARLAVAEVSLLSGDQNEICHLYRERLTADLSQRTRYVIVERANLEALLEEIELSQSDLSIEEQRLEVGKMLGAEALVELTIAELPEGTEMFVRLTEVETARILYARSFRDFDDEPASSGDETAEDDGGTDYDPETELSAEDYSAIVRPPAEESGGASADALVLRPDREQRARSLVAEHRAAGIQGREELAVNSRLYRLKRENPGLYWALVEARRGLGIIARDREMFLLFVFHNRELADRLREQHPVVGRRLYRRFQRLRTENPGKDAFVRRYVARYGRLVLRDRLLAELVRRRFDALTREF
jgi:hypothetical protein